MAKLTRFSDLTPLSPILTESGELLSPEDKWFKVYKLPCDIFAIFEPYHFQEVISYLILGCEKALLLDTGMGLGGNIRLLVEQLTKLPITVVNTHSHFDHTGGNYLFDSVYLLDVSEFAELLTRGYSLPADDENLTAEAYTYPGDLWFDAADIKVKPCNVIPVSSGHIFDLGGRSLRVIATPGHSDDGLMLTDDENKLLFTGDTVYPAPLYAHLSQSNLLTYRDTVYELSKKFSDYTLLCSHNNPIWEGLALSEIAKAFDIVIERKAMAEKAKLNVSDSNSSDKAVQNPQRYEFGDFSIIA